MKEKLTITQLEQYLSKAAWILKGPVDASDFKLYIFPILFFKRISDVYYKEFQIAFAESNGDANYASLPEFHRFAIPNECHWNDFRETTNNVGLAIEKALNLRHIPNPLPRRDTQIELMNKIEMIEATENESSILIDNSIALPKSLINQIF